MRSRKSILFPDKDSPLYDRGNKTEWEKTKNKIMQLNGFRVKNRRATIIVLK